MNTWLNVGLNIRHSLVMAVVVSLGLALTDAQAVDQNEIFTIRNVEIDATAGTASEARAQAMRQGQAKAFVIMMRRMLAEQDWPQAPKVDAAALSSLVSSLEVADERSSAVRYVATLTVQFHPQATRDLLKSSGLAFTQTMAPSVLVVPFMQFLGADYLWQDDNPWRAAWQAHDLNNRLARYAVAKGDAMDRLMAPPFEVLAASSSMLHRLAGRYETENALVAVLTLEPDLAGDGYMASVRLLGGSGEEVILEDTPVAASALAATPTAEILTPLVEAVLAARDNQWKATTLVRMDQGGDVTLLAPIRGLKNWTELKRRLDRVSLVEKLTLVRLSTGEALLAMRYVGTWESLVVAMEGAGLKLDQQATDWLLYLTEAAPKSAPQAVAPSNDDWVDGGEPALEPR